MEPRLKLLLAGAALTGVWSAWIALDATAPVVAATPAAPTPRAGNVERVAVATMPASTSTSTSMSAAPAPAPRASVDTEQRPDAFALRNWQPPPPPPPPAPPPPPPPPPAVPPPPPPPPLPYRFVGLLADPSAPKTRVFLSLGEKLLVASPGDVLEGGFRLESIGAQELVFVHLQQNVTVKLSAAGGQS